MIDDKSNPFFQSLSVISATEKQKVVPLAVEFKKNVNGFMDVIAELHHHTRDSSYEARGICRS